MAITTCTTMPGEVCMNPKQCKHDCIVAASLTPEDKENRNKLLLPSIPDYTTEFDLVLKQIKDDTTEQETSPQNT